MEVFPKFWFKDCLIIWQKAFKKLSTNNKMKNKNSSPAQQFTETFNFGFWEKKGACQTSYSHSFAGRKNKFSASKIKVSPLITRLLACWQCANTNQSHRPQNQWSKMTALTAFKSKRSSVAGLLLLLSSHQWEDLRMVGYTGDKKQAKEPTPQGAERGKNIVILGSVLPTLWCSHMVFYPFSLPPRSKGREGQAFHTGEGDLNKHLTPDSTPQHSSSEDRWVYWANLFTVMWVTTKASAKHGLEQLSRWSLHLSPSLCTLALSDSRLWAIQAETHVCMRWAVWGSWGPRYTQLLPWGKVNRHKL